MDNGAAEIAKANDVFMASIRLGDWARFMQLYAKDAVILPTGSPTRVGPDGAGVFLSFAE